MEYQFMQSLGMELNNAVMVAATAWSLCSRHFEVQHCPALE